ncbi:MAG TPA: hypothetical protein VFW87_02790 [Pirellulales bacterium]|nr:hypothetical protein [Pirellulales bacterium]
MAQTNIEPPVAWQPPAGHRPMSLLLQALRQIDSKLPLCATTSAEPAFCLLPPAPAAEAVASAPVIVQSADAESIVVAPFAALTAKPVDSRSLRRQTRPATPGDRRLAEQVTAVLKPADKVLAIAAVDAESEAAPFVADLALGLAADEARGVVVIELRPESRRRSAGIAAVELADLIEGRARWEAVAASFADERLSVLPVVARASDARIPAGDLRRCWRAALDYADYLMIDATGLGRVPGALLCSCDAAFLVVRKGRTSRGAAWRRAEQLRQAGAGLRACVLVDS